MIKSGRRQPGVLIVTALAAATLSVAPASATTGQTAGSTRCSAIPVASATPVTSLTSSFASLGDDAQYVLAASGLPLLADGAALTSDCVRTPGIQSIVRFSARSISGTGSIHVEVSADRGTVVLDGGYVTAPATLTALSAVVLPWDRRQSKSATDLKVRLTAVGGSFEIGDVYVDPFVQR
ncbi:MAG: hypothetical protein QOH16_3714 [Gaiellaceae bacterium]|nr:hypothetical protein [Gaiellaceae bacterium]